MRKLKHLLTHLLLIQLCTINSYGFLLCQRPSISTYHYHSEDQLSAAYQIDFKPLVPNGILLIYNGIDLPEKIDCFQTPFSLGVNFLTFFVHVCFISHQIGTFPQMGDFSRVLFFKSREPFDAPLADCLIGATSSPRYKQYTFRVRFLDRFLFTVSTERTYSFVASESDRWYFRGRILNITCTWFLKWVLQLGPFCVASLVFLPLPPQGSAAIFPIPERSDPTDHNT